MAETTIRRKHVGAMEVAYDASVLEPRPWTAAQAEWAAEAAEDLAPGPLLELCCGAGHIGLLTALLSRRDAVLVDSSPSAHRFAEQNAAAVCATGLAVDVRLGSMTDVLDPSERFPLVVADPPYIPSEAVGQFPDDPRTAIDGGVDGLDLARLCLDVAVRHLTPGGVVVLQLRDAAQATALTAASHGPPGLASPEVRVVPGRGALLRMRRRDGVER